MERGSSTHGAREDDMLAAQLAGQLGPGGTNREEFVQAESMGDDTDPPEVTAVSGGGDDTDDGPGSAAEPTGDQDQTEMRRLQHDMEVAADWDPATDAERA